MARRLVIVHRWAGKPDGDFYPWLEAEVRRPPALFDTVVAPAMPEPGKPTPAGWGGGLVEALGQEPGRGTVLLGHSVGCQTVVRYLAGLPTGQSVEGVLLVAGWWEVDSPWDSLRPWLDVSGVDLERARAAAGKVVVLLSDNDPFTADYRRNERLWKERLGARVEVVPGGKHFNGEREPAVLEALRASFG